MDGLLSVVLRFSMCDLLDKAGVLKEISMCSGSDPLQPSKINGKRGR